MRRRVGLAGDGSATGRVSWRWPEVRWWGENDGLRVRCACREREREGMREPPLVRMEREYVCREKMESVRR